MDTKEELRRDDFIKKHWDECVTCKYYYKDYCNLHEEYIEQIEKCEDWRLQ